MSRRLVFSVTLCGLMALGLLAVSFVPAQPPAGNQPVGVNKEAIPAGPMTGVKMAASRVIGVTVYPSNAVVTREVDVPEGAGTFELTVTPLPPTTVGTPLYTEGTENIRVLATRLRTRPVQEDVREDVRQLQDELKILQQSQEKVDADLKA